MWFYLTRWRGLVWEKGDYVFSPEVSSEEPACAPLNRELGNHLLSYTTVHFFPAQGSLVDLTDGPHGLFWWQGSRKFPGFPLVFQVVYWATGLAAFLNWSVLNDSNERLIAILRLFAWSDALVIQIRAGFCFVWVQELSYLINFDQDILKKIIFYFPVFLNDIWTHSPENAALSQQPFSLWRGTCSIWSAEFLEGPRKHSSAVKQIHEPFHLQLLRNHTALCRNMYIGFIHHFDPF